ncbi:hypothetical protein CISIN_1g001624mg [Citrus sinensis]|uniref:Leucine-rich repeat-containing N-terminal plant-type domain-containing protein n=1 Tax=Citrus sinensis TaxID=2711 RepID=A0A067DLA1_CITSI|nr:hypothetical protein CISIN_1g001624mg [Citrus sinensis]
MSVLQLSWLFLIPLLTNFGGINTVLVSGQCQSDQQSLLLQMKSSLVFNSSLSFRMVQWSQSTDCCTWCGVDCDEAGRVIGLDLSEESISGRIDNSSPLLSLKYLQSLNLAFNMFNATEIPSGLGNLTNLTHLNLSNAGFAGQIPIQVSAMTRLVTLDLSSSYSFGGPLKLENPNLSGLLQNLAELRALYLDGVNISAPGIEWCQALSSLVPKLRVLSLSSCYLSGPIHPSLAKLQSLSVICLDQNDLSSPVPEFLADFFNLTSLNLSSSGLNGTFPETILQVHTLQTLDLSGNSLLRGSLPDFPKNSSLRTLMLSYANFSGVLPDSIGNLKNLSRLDLARCNLSGSIPTSLAKLTQLVYLDLSSNKFVGPIPSLHMSKNLTHLDLSNNALPGAISSTDWEHLSNLVYVDLRNNALNGSIPRSLFSIPMLQQLLLANNKFGGPIPEFSNASYSALDTLDLSANRLEGPIPMSIFELKNLKILMLSSNKLNGTVQLAAIQRLRNLIRLELSYNNLTVNASGDSSFPSQVRTLRLASCKLKVIPNLKSQSKLFNLDLSDNQISGEIPNWVWEIGNGGLEYLNLSHNLLSSLQRPYSISDLNLMTVLDLHSNQLQGNIPHPPRNAVLVDYSNNSFTSSIPGDIGNSMNFTIFFSLSSNSITGVIPETICRAKYLLVLDLSNNKLSGKMPTCLIKMSDILGVLNLRGNSLSGTLSVTFPGNCGLQTLDLNENQLGGTVPKSLANCRKLEVLDLGNNKIRDTFPCWLKNISSLRVLVLRSNSFYGSITCRENDDSWPMLQIVDIASNNFGGRVPQKCITSWKAMMSDEDEAQSNFKDVHFELLTDIFYQDVVTVTWKGREMELVKILSIFTSIDFSRNNFDGPIPEKIGRLKSLYGLNFSQNAFGGPIPSTIGNLQQLESLDLSMNHLSDQIPIQLANLTFLSVLNLSHNNLEGNIPVSTQLQSFSPTSFEGNEGLCGAPLNVCPPNSSKALPSAPASTDEIDWFFIVMAIGFAVGFGSVVAPLMFSRRVNKWYNNLINRFINCRFCV